MERSQLALDALVPRLGLHSHPESADQWCRQDLTESSLDLRRKSHARVVVPATLRSCYGWKAVVVHGKEPSDVEADVEDVTVLDDVGLPFQPL